jgi:hypothetical protein
MNRILNFSCLDPDYPISELTVTGLERVYCIHRGKMWEMAG